MSPAAAQVSSPQMVCLVEWELDYQEATKALGTWEAPAAPRVGPVAHLGSRCTSPEVLVSIGQVLPTLLPTCSTETW
jgi:hypothetical protein